MTFVGGFLWIHRFPPDIGHYIQHHARKLVGFIPDRVKPKSIKLLFFASPLSTQYWGVSAKTVWLEIRITYSSGEPCLPADCFFQRTKRVGLVQSRHQHHLIECNLFSPWHSNLPLTLSNIIYHTTQNHLFPFGYSLLLHKLIILNWLSVNVSLYPTIMLSMVLFSILVIVLLFEANLCNFLIVYLWRPIYQDRRFGIPLTSLSPSHICACPKTGHGFLTSYVVVFV